MLRDGWPRERLAHTLVIPYSPGRFRVPQLAFANSFWESYDVL
jgi:hypothetical protein